VKGIEAAFAGRIAVRDQLRIRESCLLHKINREGRHYTSKLAFSGTQLIDSIHVDSRKNAKIDRQLRKLGYMAYMAGVQKLLFLGSTCVYPKFAKQPMSEDQLLTGELEPTNQWYAIAKVAGIKLCEAYRRQYGSDFVSVMPTNLYGPGDNYHPEHSHVVAALIRRFHEAKVADAST
jgi:hypothetical protein